MPQSDGDADPKDSVGGLMAAKDEETTVANCGVGGLVFETTAESERGIQSDAPVNVSGLGVKDEGVGFGVMDGDTRMQVQGGNDAERGCWGTGHGLQLVQREGPGMAPPAL